ncbi:MAG: hypothetical protein AB9856_06980 [Cellulosilyticaceae bacterium]
MNYIWNVLLKAKEENVNPKNIIFKAVDSYSPYMELANEDLNISEIEGSGIMPVNPYYRFYPIFKDILNINVEESQETREVITDIVMHLLGQIDLRQGMNKQEYYKKFIEQDLLAGVLGIQVTKVYKSLDTIQKEVLLNGFLALYQTGASLALFKNILKSFFPNSILYVNQDNQKELLVYLGEKRTLARQEKIDLLTQSFLNINTTICLYWEYHFGILGVEETIQIEEMVLY